ncbi:MAG: hypothetical protein LLG04_07700 [Parachlamydia sp.]|nr:hypothetical protein [Parachlamydia sp.]
MQEFYNCLINVNGMAFGTGVIIFLITLFLVAKRLIGFTLTLLFLLFALVAAFGVANKDLVRKYFENLSKGKTETYQASGAKAGEATISEQLQKAYDDLKSEFDIQKKKFQSFLEEKRASEGKKEETKPEQR